MKKILNFIILCSLLALACEKNPTEAESTYFRISGRNMQYWETILGDSVMVSGDESAVTLNDINTRHLNDRSMVEVNISNRKIKAHNVNYYAKSDVKAMNVIHNVAFAFNLPVLPASSNAETNGDIIEAGLYIWDGSTTKTEYAVAFRWIVNPWRTDFGKLYTWSGSGWQFQTSITPDTLDHVVEISLDRMRNKGSLKIDNHNFTNVYSKTEYENQPTGITARIEFSATNANPTGVDKTPSFTVNFKNWKWEWSI